MGTKKKASKKAQNKVADIVTLKLTHRELTHLRNLMGVVVPTSGSGETRSVSGALGILSGHEADEASLWERVQDACINSGIPVGHGTPDFAVLQDRPVTMMIALLKGEGNDD